MNQKVGDGFFGGLTNLDNWQMTPFHFAACIH